MRIGIIGQKWLAREIFDQLRSCYDVGFIAVPDSTDRLHSAAVEAGVPVVCYRDGMRQLLSYQVDLLICAHAFAFIPDDVRGIAKYVIGYHPSLLPLHRGKNSVADAVNGGDRVTGGTVYHLDSDLDAGPVAFQDWCFIHEKETPSDLWRRALGPMGVELLSKAVAHLDAYGFLPAEPQQALNS